MSPLKIISALLAIVALAVPAAAAAAPGGGAVVFSKTTKVGEGEEKEDKGGLYAVRDGRLNQLTVNPTDSEPNFAPDGRTIAFVRDGDLYSVRPDGSGERHLTSGAELDSAPLVSPNGKYVVFERRASAGAPADLYTVGVTGGGLRALSSGPDDDRQAAFAADGKAIVFVRGVASPGGNNDDLYSVRPTGAGLARLTSTAGVDEFEPRYFAAGILFSRGESSPGPAAYADIYTMKRSGAKIRPQVAGVGSAYVEDVSPDGHTVVFRRDQGLWAKRIGNTKARKLSQLPDGSETSAVFSSDGKRVAAFVAVENEQALVSIDVANGRESRLADAAHYAERRRHPDRPRHRLATPPLALLCRNRSFPSQATANSGYGERYNGGVGDIAIGSEVAGYRVDAADRARRDGGRLPGDPPRPGARGRPEGDRPRARRPRGLPRALPARVPPGGAARPPGGRPDLRLARGRRRADRCDAARPRRRSAPPDRPRRAAAAGPRRRPARPGRGSARCRARGRDRPPRREAAQHPGRRRARLPLGLRARQGAGRGRGRQRRLGGRHRRVHVARAVARHRRRSCRRRLLARLRPLRVADRHPALRPQGSRHRAGDPRGARGGDRARRRQGPRRALRAAPAA